MTLVTEYILRVLPESYSMLIALILSVGVVFFTNLVIGCFEQRRRAAKSIANVKRYMLFRLKKNIFLDYS